MALIDKVVYCNILHSITAAFLELEKAKFTGAILVSMFATNTFGPYVHSKQSKAFHARSKLTLNCEKIGFDYQKWLYVCHRSQSNSQIYLPCSRRLF